MSLLFSPWLFLQEFREELEIVPSKRRRYWGACPFSNSAAIDAASFSYIKFIRFLLEVLHNKLCMIHSVYWFSHYPVGTNETSFTPEVHVRGAMLNERARFFVFRVLLWESVYRRWTDIRYRCTAKSLLYIAHIYFSTTGPILNPNIFLRDVFPKIIPSLGPIPNMGIPHIVPKPSHLEILTLPAPVP